MFRTTSIYEDTPSIKKKSIPSILRWKQWRVKITRMLLIIGKNSKSDRQIKRKLFILCAKGSQDGRSWLSCVGRSEYVCACAHFRTGINYHGLLAHL